MYDENKGKNPIIYNYILIVTSYINQFHVDLLTLMYLFCNAHITCYINYYETK